MNYRSLARMLQSQSENTGRLGKTSHASERKCVMQPFFKHGQLTSLDEMRPSKAEVPSIQIGLVSRTVPFGQGETHLAIAHSTKGGTTQNVTWLALCALRAKERSKPG